LGHLTHKNPSPI